MRRVAPEMKLLALHGWGQDAALFASKRTKDLQRRLQSLQLVLDCADAPFQIGHTAAERGWWTYRPEDWDGSLSNPLELLSRASFEAIGLDESLDRLSAQWRDGQYDGILGFSQGAVMGSILCAKLCADPEARRPRCAILISGFAQPIPTGLSYYPPTQPLDVPSLHVWGAQDTHIPPASSEALSHRFLNPVLHVHPSHHFIPQKAGDCKVFSDFLASVAPTASAEGVSRSFPSSPPASDRPTAANAATSSQPQKPAIADFYVTVGIAVWVAEQNGNPSWPGVVTGFPKEVLGTWSVQRTAVTDAQNQPESILVHWRQLTPRSVADKPSAEHSVSTSPATTPAHTHIDIASRGADVSGADASVKPQQQQNHKQTQKQKQKQKQNKAQLDVPVDSTFANPHNLEFVDIGANLTDPQYQGEYNGKQKHQPDLKSVVRNCILSKLSAALSSAGSLK